MSSDSVSNNDPVITPPNVNGDPLNNNQNPKPKLKPNSKSKLSAPPPSAPPALASSNVPAKVENNVSARQLENVEKARQAGLPQPSAVPSAVPSVSPQGAIAVPVPPSPNAQESEQPGFFSRILASGSSAIAAAAAAQDGGGMTIWNFFNALAFIILITLIFVGIVYALSGTASVAKVKANWEKYRCDPSIMPFAALYGQNTADNFNYCLGNIFDTKSLDITGPFSTVLGNFTSLLSMMTKSINSLRVSIATMGGGINVMFQDFTDRISTFFFQLRLSAIRIKALIGRMYAIMFAVMYMGLSGITGMTSFSNTVLFSFLDTFCFTPYTEVEVIKKGHEKAVIVPILHVEIGDILLPTKSRVTSKFHFAANGQPMVTLYDKSLNKYVNVSSNHYLLDKDKWVRAEEHADSLTSPQPFVGNSLICLNTSDHIIPIGNYIFRDYDETEENNVDEKTMRFIEQTINGQKQKGEPTPSYPFREYYPAIHPSTKVRLKDGSDLSIGEVPLGTKLSTGCTIIGKVHREVTEYCLMPFGISSSTLIWNKKDYRWQRAATMSKLWTTKAIPTVFVSLFVTPSSIIELADGTMIRDSMELCSPDAELYYAEQLKQLKT